MRAEVILMKCVSSRNIYAVRTEERDGDWVRTWAFRIKERTAMNEGFDKTVIHGNLYADDEYNGCPYCGATNFVQCGRCGKLSCWNKEERITCGWCGLTGDITTTTDAINVRSGDM